MLVDIREVARLTGVTSRTLRHYDALGLLIPVSHTASGYRQYDEGSLLKLQQILLLRQFGLSLSSIGEILSGEVDYRSALISQEQQLINDRDRLDSQLKSVRTTIERLEKGQEQMMADMFDGFNPAVHEEEVKERWGEEASVRSIKWWNSMGAGGQKQFQQVGEELQDAYDQVLLEGLSATDDEVQAIAKRHYAWIVEAWAGNRPSSEQLTGIAQMYVADPRFAANYNRVSNNGPQFVCDALTHFAGTL